MDGTPTSPFLPDDPRAALLWRHPSVGLMAVGTLAWVAGTMTLVAGAGDLAAGRWYTPALLATAHLLGLSMVSTIIVAVVIHLAPNLSAAPIRAGRPIGGAFALGGILLAIGLAGDSGPVAAGGGLLLVGAVVGLVINVARLWRGRRGSWPEPMAGLALSSGWLVVVLPMGLVALAARHGLGPNLDRPRLVAAHLTVAALGWAGGLVVAMGTRLGPMVLLSPVRHLPLARLALGLWHGGVLLLVLAIVGANVAAARTGVLLQMAAIALFLLYLLGIVRRRRRRPPISVVHLLAGAGALLIAGGALLIDPVANAPLAGLLALVGLVAGATAGHLQIMLPTMCWVARFSARRRLGIARPPVAHLAPPVLTGAEAALFLVGLAALAGGVAAGSPLWARLGALALSGSALMVAGCVATALLRRHHPPPGGRSLPILRVAGPARPPSAGGGG